MPPFTINSQWEDVNTKVKEAAKYVILDLSECGDMSTTVNGTYPNPYGNNMNIIMGTPTIKGIILPPSLTSIGDYAFGGCRSLTSITILSGVFNIGEGAFFACSGLTNVIIPDTVISIGNFAFDNTGLTNITIPPGVNSIGNFAFRSCAFTSIIIPNGVDSIGNGAFEICVSLTNITISASVTSIGNNAFESCDSLTSVTFEPGSTIAGASFGSGVFPEDYGFGYDIGGETLRTAYLNPGGGAGTYTREENGSTWTKVP